MRIGGLLLGVVVAGAASATDTPAAWAQEMERVPARLSAFLPRTPLPTSDDDGAGCRGMPGTRHGRCEGDEFCGTLLSSEGRKGRRLSGMLDELGGRRIHWGAQNGPAPTKMPIKIESAQAFCVSIFGGVGTFAISRLSVSTLKYRILRHPVDPALGARSHPSCRYWSRRSYNIIFDVCDATSFGPYCGSYHRYVADDDYARYSRFADQKRLARAAVGRLEGRTSGKPIE